MFGAIAAGSPRPDDRRDNDHGGVALLSPDRLSEAPHAASAEQVVAALETRPEEGLYAAEVRARRRRFGPNRLREAGRVAAWRILVEQFRSIIVALLGGAALLSFWFGEIEEGASIAVVLAINAAIGFFTELRAVRSMEALRRLGRVTARVRRDGQVREVAAETLVPGDIVLVEGGDVVSADMRVIEGARLAADESILTGESVPAAKSPEPVAGDVPLAERASMLFKGTGIANGSGEAVVVATGMDTELGRISELVAEAQPQVSPLERRLDRLSAQLVWVTLALAAVVSLAGLARGRDPYQMLETGIALAVAAVPEGLPIVATIALARGMWRMARRNALIEHLSAVETLGSATVIFTDKTGTLTENRMRAARLELPTGPVELADETEDEAEVGALARRALEIGVLCNNATLGERGTAEDASGDPTEVALLVAGRRAGLERPSLLDARPEEREHAFDAESKLMATVHRGEEGVYAAIKGAPESVLTRARRVRTADGAEDLDDAGRQAWLDRNEAMAGEGLRVLALAEATLDDPEDDPYASMTLVGLVGLLDPPRRDVADAIATAKRAGIRVIMLTGDNPRTASAIAEAVGLADGTPKVAAAQEVGDPDELPAERRRALLAVDVFARVSPAQKLDLIALYQSHGDIVAMTGDGVNDAPALKKADIGIAMGRRGSQVAREAADMVLRDDAFQSIAAAMAQGRAIFDNIRSFLVYLLSGNLGEIVIVTAAAVSGLPLPLLALQILYLNIVIDVFPALALGVGEGAPGIMRRPPRPTDEPFLTRGHWAGIVGYAVLITLSTLGAFTIAYGWLGYDGRELVTVSFMTLAFGRLWHVFNMRAANSTLLGNAVARNPAVWGAIALCTGLILATAFLPVLSEVLRMVVLDATGWALALGASLVPLLLGQVAKSFSWVVAEKSQS